MDPETAMYAERGSPQFDCVGCYLWIWERLIQTADGAEADARLIRRDPPPNSPRSPREVR